jgi:valyl-tRNA synthetase
VGEARVARELACEGLAFPERWIVSRLAVTAAEVDQKLEAFRFDEACHALYHFFWSDFCDWYIELAKPALGGEAARPRVGEVLLTVLDRALRLLHPAMPFLTEELWQRLPGHESAGVETICLASYPAPGEFPVDSAAEREMAWLVEAVSFVRNQRAAAGHSPKVPARLRIGSRESEAGAFLFAQAPLLAALAGIAAIEEGAGETSHPQLSLDRIEIAVTFAAGAAADPGPARDRIEADLARIEKLFESASARLEDPVFLAKAPPKIVDGARAQLAELSEQRSRLRAMLDA